MTQAQGLALALALGLMIGLERGWQEREEREGQRVAGIRTYGLMGLLGGVWGLLAGETDLLVLAIAFAVLASILVTGYWINHVQNRDPDIGVTGLLAGLLTFAFGAMATLGHGVLAAIGAGVTTILLSLKPTLHHGLEQLEPRELNAALKLLVISVVILPLLPDQGYGPWDTLNPHRIWWMVVLIAGISFVGYFAMKTIGARRGLLVTGLFSGLASSTAATVSLSRLNRKTTGAENLLAAGILIACATMFPRMLIITSVVNWSLAVALAWPIAVMTVVSYLAAAVVWWLGAQDRHADQVRLQNPFELKPALIFGAMLAVIMLLSRALNEYFDETGVYLLALISGLADVDAIMLSLADMAGDRISLETATLAVLIAASANSVVKAGLALGIGGTRLGVRVILPTVLVIASGMGTWWFMTGFAD
ncbi:MAG: MgtC/SapB family protein [Halothiobacillaceae bacterium]